MWAKVGGWVTVVYVLAVAIIVLDFADPFRDKLYDMKPNELGDMLAGFFAPLAFLWLFVATMMQSEELRLQRNEIGENRIVMQEQADAAKSQADFLKYQTEAMQTQAAIMELQGKQSAETAAKVYRLELFEKRYSLFFLVKDYRDKLPQTNWEASCTEFDDLRHQAYFLFPADVSEWFEFVFSGITEGRALYLKQQALAKDDNGQTRNHLPKEVTQEFHEIGRELTKMKYRVVAQLQNPILYKVFGPSMMVTD